MVLARNGSECAMCKECGASGRLDALQGGGSGGGGGSYLCSTPSSCDGVECVFAFPVGARAIGTRTQVRCRHDRHPSSRAGNAVVMPLSRAAAVCVSLLLGRRATVARHVTTSPPPVRHRRLITATSGGATSGAPRIATSPSYSPSPPPPPPPPQAQPLCPLPPSPAPAGAPKPATGGTSTTVTVLYWLLHQYCTLHVTTLGTYT